ncbi:hypothetical protein RUND412_008236 [Rhizina undulata]
MPVCIDCGRNWNQKAALVTQLLQKWKDEKGKEHTNEVPKQSMPKSCKLDLIKGTGIPEGTKAIVVGVHCVLAGKIMVQYEKNSENVLLQDFDDWRETLVLERCPYLRQKILRQIRESRPALKK